MALTFRVEVVVALSRLSAFLERLPPLAHILKLLLLSQTKSVPAPYKNNSSSSSQGLLSVSQAKGLVLHSPTRYGS